MTRHSSSDSKIYSTMNTTTTLSNKYVFISYKSEEQSYADALKRLLEGNGIKTWMAPYDIPGGSEYGAVIIRAIKDSSGMVLLLSEMAQTSQHILREMDIATNAGKVVIPLRIDNSQLTDSFEYRLLTTQIVAVKSIDPNDLEIKKVLGVIKQLVK